MIPHWLQERRKGQRTPLYSDSRTGRNINEAPDPLTRDVAFNRHSMNDGHHVSPYDNGQVQVGTDGIEVRLVQGIDEDALRRTLSMATRATIGLDLHQPLPGDWVPCTTACKHFRELQLNEYADTVIEMEDGRRFTPIRDESIVGWRRQPGQDLGWHQVPGGDWEEMLKGGLQTALESQVIVFAVSGVSRTATHQIVRSRRAAFHQQSQRASYMGDRPEVRMPDSIWRNPRARRAFHEAVLASHLAYRVATEEDISYQDARFILPEGTTNYIMMEYTLREFINVYAYRGCSMFQWEIVAVMRKARALLVEAYPWLEPYIKISCEKTNGAKDRLTHEPDGAPGSLNHTCTFQGWERVEGQCAFPWARDTNRTFRSEAHEIGRRKSFPIAAGTPVDKAVEQIIDVGRESLRRWHPSLAKELEHEDCGIGLMDCPNPAEHPREGM